MSSLADILRPGDCVVVGQAPAEPRTLVRELFEVARRTERLHVFCGYSLDEVWAEAPIGALSITTYCGQGTIRSLVDRGDVGLVPAQWSELGRLFATQQLPSDVVLVQVGPPDQEGFHHLGCTVDYISDAIEHARLVVVEVNNHVPSTGTRVHRDRVVIAHETTQALQQLLPSQPSDAEEKLGAQVAELVSDGAAIQLGIGRIPAAVAAALTTRRGLVVRSGMVGDWFIGLARSGAVDVTDEDAVRSSIAIGTNELYDLIRQRGRNWLVSAREVVASASASPHRPYIAVNSGIEVDLRGQVNAELGGSRYVGAVGGQPEYLRGARSVQGGLAVVAVTCGLHRGGIVPRIDSGVVTTAQHDVDIVVTQYGAADLRGTTLDRRAKLLASIAHPDRRPLLMDAAAKATAPYNQQTEVIQ